MNNKANLDLIQLEAFEVQQMEATQYDYFEELDNLSFKFDMGEPNAAYMLAYEVSRVIQRMKVISSVIKEKAKRIESMAEEIEQLQLDAKKELDQSEHVHFVKDEFFVPNEEVSAKYDIVRAEEDSDE